MRKGNERGAIVVEATVSLTAFIFAIFTILSIVNVYYIQAKISMALLFSMVNRVVKTSAPATKAEAT